MRISNSAIDEWLARLAAEAEVLVPQRRTDGAVTLAPMAEGERTGDYRVLHESPRRILMPQSDEIVRFEAGAARAVLDDRTRVLFGLRPCDAAAVAILDEFFGRDYADPNYQARRRRTALIVVACEDADDACFCASTQTGPVAETGFDLQLFPTGSDHLVQVGSDRGAALVDAGGQLFTEAGAKAQGRLAAFRRRAEQAQQARVDLARARQILLAREEPEGFWQSIADRCLMCGGCAYLCPTCTCYDVTDTVQAAASGPRRRSWDTCVLEGFTRESSGHNPRGPQAARCAHRYLHKIGEGGAGFPFRCVGCGRCAEACLNDLSLRAVASELLRQVDAKS